MDPQRLRALLEGVKSGTASIAVAVEELKRLPFRQLDDVAMLDQHRHLRRGFPEVILGEGKTAAQVVTIMSELAKSGGNVLATRVTKEVAEHVTAHIDAARYHEAARALVVEQESIRPRGRGRILVMSAGTSDSDVAEEAVLTARLMGNEVERLYDVGVAGVHRTLAHVDVLRNAAVIIVIAGMEGALPSLVAGLVERPVIAVPTSVGYGASYGGLAALLGMLSSCAAGVTVVNIDNGFGAAYAASVMNRAHPEDREGTPK